LHGVSVFIRSLRLLSNGSMRSHMCQLSAALLDCQDLGFTEWNWRGATAVLEG
jgi:hypothetical protein